MFGAQIFAQTTDTTNVIRIKSVVKPADIIEQNIDSTQKKFFVSNDATSLLETNSNTYVKNYGLSNLSTLSIRGSSVAQTAVFWNGIPIQNTMLGLTDLSTVPNFFFDNMSVYPSGFEQRGRGQSVAGRLELNSINRFKINELVSVEFLGGYENFGNIITGAKLKYTAPKLNLQLKYYNRQGKNQYCFENDYLDKKIR